MGYYSKRFWDDESVIPRNGLVAEWLFNNNYLDTAGSNNLTTNGLFSFISDKNGNVLSAINDNNANSYLQLDSYLFDVNHTISMFINTNGIVSSKYFIGSSLSAQGVRYDGTSFLLFTGGVISTITWVNQNKIINIIIKRISTTTYEWYIDGIYIGNTIKDSTTLVVNKIGDRSPTAGLGYAGYLDNIRFYNRLLTNIEITQLANE